MTITAQDNTAISAVSTQIDAAVEWTGADEAEYRDLLDGLARDLKDEVTEWAERGVHFASYTEYLYVKEWAWFHDPRVSRRTGKPIAMDDLHSYSEEDVNRIIGMVRSEPWWMPPLEPEVQEAVNTEVARIRSVMNEPWEPLGLGRLRRIIGAMRHPHADPFVEWPKPTVWYEQPTASANTMPLDGPGTNQETGVDMTAGAEAQTMTAALLGLKARLFSEDEFDQRPPPEWLIEGVLPKRSLTYVVGEPGDGKTFVTLDLAYRLASGQNWWGHPTKQVGHVLYIAAEDSIGLQMRARAWRSRFLGSEHTGRVSFLAHAPQLGDPEDLHALMALVSELNPGVVVIDTQNRVTAGFDENSSKDMGVVLRFAASLQEAGVAVILVHHPSRGGKAPRGSSSQEGAADVVVFVSKDEDDGTITIRNTKQKNAPEFKPLTMRLQGEGESAVLVEATPATWLAEVTVVGWMNELNLPISTGYDKAKAALEAAGHSDIRKRTLEAALKLRKNPNTPIGG